MGRETLEGETNMSMIWEILLLAFLLCLLTLLSQCLFQVRAEDMLVRVLYLVICLGFECQYW